MCFPEVFIENKEKKGEFRFYPELRLLIVEEI
jgi:hypothetical protein